MFCIPFRTLSPKPRLSSCDQEKNNWAPHPHRTTRRDIARNVLRRRTSSPTLIEEPTDLQDISRGNHPKPLKRKVVLAWKRLNAPTKPRESRRFSYLPPGFAFVSASTLPGAPQAMVPETFGTTTMASGSTLTIPPVPNSLEGSTPSRLVGVAKKRVEFLPRH
ncbi:hypothetical protein VNI00_000661 [Paramarasmius palmivorus]|uniref:Uncharacterized protein n=1 Tax=Paramarasmius palmivorus TaxID=297713 RepID=A0AAW0EBP2_9AGAR